MSALTPERLAELRAIAEKATPGPWRVERGTTRHLIGSPMCGETCEKGQAPIRIEQSETGELHTHYWMDAVDDVIAENGHHVFCGGHGYDDYGGIRFSDAQHLASFDPPTVLALLDALEQRVDLTQLRNEPHLFLIVEAMERYGGSFVKAMAEAWKLADPDNRAILEKGFAHYFDKYESQFVAGRVAAPDPEEP